MPPAKAKRTRPEATAMTALRKAKPEEAQAFSTRCAAAPARPAFSAISGPKLPSWLPPVAKLPM